VSTKRHFATHVRWLNFSRTAFIMDSNQIPIVWAPQAKTDIAGQTAADYGGVQPEVFHEKKVQEYWAANKTDAAIKDANKARIRFVMSPSYYEVFL
jgi:hypothetical protein